MNDRGSAVVPPLRTLLGKGTSMETNRTTSRRTLAWRTSALLGKMPFFRSLLLLLPTRAHLQALSRHAGTKQETWKVCLPWDGCPSYGLMAPVQAQYSTNVQKRQEEIPPAGAGFPSPASKTGAFKPVLRNAKGGMHRG